MQQRSIEIGHTDTPALQANLELDRDSTSDLQDESTADLTPNTERATTDARNSAATSQMGDATSAVSRDFSSATATVPADLQQINDRWPEPIVKQRALGFFAFAACTLIAILFTSEKQPTATRPPSEIVSASTPPTHHAPREQRATGGISAASSEKLNRAEGQKVQGAARKRDSGRAVDSLGSVVFESRSFATTEKAVVAVFIVKRTQAVAGRALVQWAALSGSADAGIDFSDASGTARFSDGQRQLAIYVPLRNDLLKEDDETFKVCLRSARNGPIAARSCAEATIRDDDNPSPT